MNLSEIVSLERGEQEGWLCLPHLESPHESHGYLVSEAPIGTCPECVEAAMHDAVHILWRPRYPRSLGLFRRGVIAGLLQQAHLLEKIDWSSGRDE